MIFPLLRDFLLSRQKANDSCFLVVNYRSKPTQQGRSPVSLAH
jgi:hypothetical protein